MKNEQNSRLIPLLLLLLQKSRPVKIFNLYYYHKNIKNGKPPSRNGSRFEGFLGSFK